MYRAESLDVEIPFDELVDNTIASAKVFKFILTL